MTYTGAMVLPNNAVFMNNDEMRYVEGGKYYSKKTCKKVFSSVATVMAISPLSVVAGAYTVMTIAKVIIQCAGKVGGLLGMVLSGIGSWAASQLYHMVMGLAKGAIGNGVDMTFNVNIKKQQFGVSYKAR
ncbi:MAG: hypothetical protein IKE52_01255 [Mogibacterium sp.]|nr:hypothetical protein [Mogibacterium sp.]